jgi:hypothetical protein
MAPLALALAGPPASSAGGEDDRPSAEPAIEQLPEPGAFWLSVELIGPRGAQLDAAEALAGTTVEPRIPRGGPPPPGELVGRVETLDQALIWVDERGFAETASGLEVFGGELYERFGVVVTSLVLTAEAEGGGTRAYPWPAPGLLPVPEGLGWRPAELVLDASPVFAAPAPRLPPASERISEVGRDHELWQLEEADRCEPDGSCLRWSRIVARQGDRFFGAWIPATNVVPRDAWVDPGAMSPVAIRPAHRDARQVTHVLVRRRTAETGGYEPPLSLSSPHVGPTWPSASVRVAADELAVLVDGVAVHSESTQPPPLPLVQPPPEP